ncbi:Ger(x)C family spore germination protein [Pelosinus baikalensis]|uniref:Ger(X)C family spore germination protein n=1 Tax=Pelosinus baikalensis TaxID=2892015 RepID=A0ABS8HRG7_9FIRM|nr:Ger(x)C family spore germination protein [Pelosinus baikalensis]MCC5465783.1 Ger(x)C family spore germination protein [Pelosinus baikalensis]
MKRILVAVILCTLLLTGCWDRRELNDIGIVVAMGLDKDDLTGNIIVTSQVVRPGALKKDGGGEPSSPVEVLTTQGNTVAEAVKNISKQFDRIAFFAHVKVLVISEQLAKEGLLPILDYFMRNSNMRTLAWLIIAKDVKAKEILITNYGIENVQANYLNNMIKNKGENSEVSTPDILTYLKAITSEGNPIGGVMEIAEYPTMPTKEKKDVTTQGVKLSGTAVFKKDKLVGYLNNTETRGLNWVTGKVKTTIINIPSPNEKEKLISINITKVSSRITPEMINGKISFTIEIKVDGDIAEQQDTSNYLKNLESFETLEKEPKDIIEREIQATLNKIQTELGSDILGFSSAYNKKYPQEWKSIKDDWNNIFPTVSSEVKVDVKLRRLGLMLKPITSDATK